MPDVSEVDLEVEVVLLVNVSVVFEVEVVLLVNVSVVFEVGVVVSINVSVVFEVEVVVSINVSVVFEGELSDSAELLLQAVRQNSITTTTSQERNFFIGLSPSNSYGHEYHSTSGSVSAVKDSNSSADTFFPST